MLPLTIFNLPQWQADLFNTAGLFCMCIAAILRARKSYWLYFGIDIFVYAIGGYIVGWLIFPAILLVLGLILQNPVLRWIFLALIIAGSLYAAWRIVDALFWTLEEDYGFFSWQNISAILGSWAVILALMIGACDLMVGEISIREASYNLNYDNEYKVSKDYRKRMARQYLRKVYWENQSIYGYFFAKKPEKPMKCNDLEALDSAEVYMDRKCAEREVFLEHKRELEIEKNREFYRKQAIKDQKKKAEQKKYDERKQRSAERRKRERKQSS